MGTFFATARSCSGVHGYPVSGIFAKNFKNSFLTLIWKKYGFSPVTGDGISSALRVVQKS